MGIPELMWTPRRRSRLASDPSYGGLWVLPQDTIVVGSPGSFQRSETFDVDIGGEELGPDEPSGLVGHLVRRSLLYQGAEYDGEGLVQRARLVFVDQSGLLFRDPVGKLVPYDVQR